MKYRADIDGLRAVAVLLVLLFHYAAGLAPGGFVGVDVFFVISGYLIIGIIAGELSVGHFSFRDFYDRRCRRILPPLAAMIGVTAVLAYLVLFPNDFRSFGQSVVAAALFVANMQFWGEAGYFDAGADTKPLLHLWSLGVEEQFYILTPIALAWGWRFGRRRVLQFMLGAFALSFIGAVIAVHWKPDDAFFLTPLRAWELLLGGLLAVAPPALPRSAALRQALSALGLAMVLGAGFFWNRQLPFPGQGALLPCLGAALLIWTGMGGIGGRLLALRPMVAVGKISYALYLWHWPLFVLWAYHKGAHPEPGELALLAALSVALSVASYFWVEAPVRQRRVLHRRARVFAATSLLIVAFCALGKSIAWTHGMPWRVPAEALAYADGADDQPETFRPCLMDGPALAAAGEPCKLGDSADAPPRFLFWGDSHAFGLMPALDQAARQAGIQGLALAHTGCLPVAAMDRQDIEPGHGCAAFNRDMTALALSSGVRHVVLAGFWSVYLEGWPPEWNFDVAAPRLAPVTGPAGDPAADLASGLDALVSQLRGAGIDVHLLGQIPSMPAPVPAWLARLSMNGHDVTQLGVPLAAHRARLARIDRILGDLAAQPGIDLTDPADLMCHDGLCPAARDGASLYFDRDHLSATGARLLAPALSGLMARIAAMPAEAGP